LPLPAADTTAAATAWRSDLSSRTAADRICSPRQNAKAASSPSRSIATVAAPSVCLLGVMPSGMLRHPLFVQWLP